MEGRLHFGTALGAAGLVILSVGVGLYAGTDLTRLAEDENRARAWNELSFQNSSWVDAFYGSVQGIRLQAENLGSSAPSGNLLHFARFRLEGGAAHTVQQLRATGVSPAHESEWMRQAALRAAQWGPTLSGHAFGILRFRPDVASTREWLGVIYREGAEVHAVATQAAQLFPYLTRYASRSDGGARRAYLVGLDGTVLAHSQDSYAGTNLKGIPIFDQALDQIAKGKRKSGVGEFESVERLPVWAAYQRVGNLPLIAVTEQMPVAQPWLATGWQTTVGKLLLTLGALLFGALAISVRPRKAAAKALVTQPPKDILDKLFTAPPLPAGVESEGATVAGPLLTQVGSKVVGSAPQAYPENIGFGETMLRDDLRASQETLRSLEEERRILAEVEEVLWKTQDPEQASRQMTEGVSRLCGSPTLFFQFQETLRSCSLKFDAGFASGHAPVEMSFPLDAHTIERLTGLAVQEGDAPRRESRDILSQNEALGRIILVRTGIAHYEAWPVFRYSALGRAAGRPRLHGVLIILQAGEAAYSRGESIGRMIRSAALVYENATHSQ